MTKKQELINGLNEDLNLELEAVLRYLYHSSSATSLLGHELRELLKADIAGELNHAIFLADKITALEGDVKITLTMPKRVKSAKDMIAMNGHGRAQGDQELLRACRAGEKVRRPRFGHPPRGDLGGGDRPRGGDGTTPAISVEGFFLVLGCGFPVFSPDLVPRPTWVASAKPPVRLAAGPSI